MSTEQQTFNIKELNLEMIAPSTDKAFNATQGGSKTVVIGKPGCFAKGTEILKYDGTIINVEDVKVGDLLMGDDSKPRQVLELCHNSDEMFKVIPKKGEPYTVNKLHNLVLMSAGSKHHKKGEIIEITVDDFLKKSKSWQDSWVVFRTGVDFEEREVKIDPYLLGLWLGDGTSATSEFTTNDNKVKEYLESYCDKEDLIFGLKFKNTICQYRISSNYGTKGMNPPLINSFRDYNLLKNKHIPQDYKSNSREVRLQLLAGLIDTDGSYDKKGNGFYFIQKNETLFDDLIFLTRSLGFACYKSKCEKRIGTYFRCHISGNVDEIPTKIKRKKASIRRTKINHLASKFKLESQGDDAYFGFMIDGNHRFLLRSFDVVRNTGKSTLVGSLLYAKKHIFPVGMAMSGSEDTNHFYRKIMPSIFVYNEYNEDAIKSFIRRQKIAMEHLDNPWSILLLDDCTDDPKVFNTPLQHGLYKKGRHYKMWYILSLQYAMDVKPVIRVNIDNVFVLREPSIKIRRIIWENYASIIPDFTMFCSIMDNITDDFTALYIQNATTSNKIEDCVFYYKAKPIPENFRFGCDDYWKFHEDRYNEDYQEPYM